jgi:MtN3 and saliva related transmembrane protein
MGGPDPITIIGAGAAICSTASFVPQALRIVRTGDAASISTRMYILTVIGFSLWSVYGSLRAEWALLASNAVCLTLSAFILIEKLRLSRGRRPKRGN